MQINALDNEYQEKLKELLGEKKYDDIKKLRSTFESRAEEVLKNSGYPAVHNFNMKPAHENHKSNYFDYN